jgi:hypothetical protein
MKIYKNNFLFFKFIFDIIISKQFFNLKLKTLYYFKNTVGL